MSDIDIGKLKHMSDEDLKETLVKIRQARAERPAPTTRRRSSSGAGFSSKGSAKVDLPSIEASADDVLNLLEKKE